jgi:hypothetical protein
MKKLFYFFLLAGLIVTCKKQTDDSSTVDSTNNYFPIKIGNTWIYDVDSIGYDDNSGTTIIDSSHHYQYKEIITENLIDAEGKPMQKLARFYRKNDSDTWASANNWTISRDNLMAQKVQENIRYVKLVFPLNSNSSWNGNMFNNTFSNTYFVEDFDQPATINGTTYDKTLKVSRNSSVNAIEEIRQFEIYARNIGLIYFLSDSINTQPIDSIRTKSRGFRYRLKLKSFQ